MNQEPLTTSMPFLPKLINHNRQQQQYLSPDETRECKSGVLAGVDTILIQVANVDLNRGMVLCSDKPVRGRAAQVDVQSKS